MTELLNYVDNSAEEEDGEADKEEEHQEEYPDVLIHVPPLDWAPPVAFAGVAPPPPAAGIFTNEGHGELSLPPPLEDQPAASANVAPPPPEHVAKAAEGQDPDVPVHGRPRREHKAPPVYPEGWIASKDVQAILNPDKLLTAEARLQALENILMRANMAESPSDATVADASTVTAATVPDDKGRESFPDLLLCHTHSAELKKPADKDKIFSCNCRMKLEVVHHCFPGILEIKGGPSRSLRGSTLTARTKNALRGAEDEPYDYVRVCFEGDLCADSAIVISAAGLYWRWIGVELHQVEGAPIWISGSDASDEQLNKLRDEALIPILETHATYPSTMVANPPPRPPPKPQ
ncbi:hypothetical protein BN946_scf185034.g1 [Trametes cinnabarina]|uniref:Uncharacterized protein n=1 Tax=Pycnoporus cinnabarinus TaxID=5643 RepID=A0A060SUL9_PYCCI|nr:hypothetical protein BN946_scf185034.g1 [Trametes cinnabarina]